MTVILRDVIVLTVAGEAATETVAASARGTPIPANDVASSEIIIKRSTDTFFIKNLLVVTSCVTVAYLFAISHRRESSSPV
jgi:hypothetical protein